MHPELVQRECPQPNGWCSRYVEGNTQRASTRPQHHQHGWYPPAHRQGMSWLKSRLSPIIDSPMAAALSKATAPTTPAALTLRWSVLQQVSGG